MTAPRIGSLFSGYGGLDLGVQAVIGGSVAWHVEFDPAPSKILAHHFPDVPNYGDITKVDWSQVEPVDVLTGGFPCQDVSLAGARAGMKDGTRSGLWSHYATAIAALRPSLVVIENVRGLLSAGAGETEEWTDEEISDLESGTDGVGEPERSGGPVLNAFGSVLGDLALLGFDAEWVGIRASDAGAPHQRFRVFIIAVPTCVGLERAGLARDWRAGLENRGDTLPDTSSDGRGEGWPESARLEGGSDHELGSQRTADVVDLLPTAVAHDSGNSVAAHLRKKPGRTQVTSLQVLAEHLLPTVTTAIASGGNARRGGDRSEELLLPGVLDLMPTVTVQDASNTGGPSRFDRNTLPLNTEVLTLTRPELGPVEQYEALWDALEDQSPFWKTTDKDYWPAIERWTRVMGRRAPAPTIPDGKDGRFRLNPKFTEWMMGAPLGWITGCGLTRNEALKACGNGVVWQQAALALSILLGRRSDWRLAA